MLMVTGNTAGTQMDKGCARSATFQLLLLFLLDPDETRMSPKFMTRHSVNCQLVQVDPEVTPYFGFLPQDMLTRSVLEFYHPEDLHFLKEVYEAGEYQLVKI